MRMIRGILATIVLAGVLMAFGSVSDQPSSAGVVSVAPTVVVAPTRIPPDPIPPLPVDSYVLWYQICSGHVEINTVEGQYGAQQMVRCIGSQKRDAHMNGKVY